MHSNFVMICFLVLVIVLTAYNFFTKRYSNKAIVSFAFVSLLYRILLAISGNSFLIFLDGLFAVVLSFIVVYFIFGLKRGAIGGGDAKFVMCIALMAGSIYTIIYCLISFIILVALLILYSNNAYRDGPNVASGFIWSVGFVILFILNFYWDSFLTVLS